jgi:hypothetical protein
VRSVIFSICRSGVPRRATAYPMDPAPMTTITFFIGDPQNSIMP